MQNTVKKTNVRFNLKKSLHAKVWNELCELDKAKYKSISNVIILALDDFFKKQRRLVDDPFFETRERELLFIEKMVEGVRAELRFFSPTVIVGESSQISQEHNEKKEKTIDEGLVDWDFLGNS